MVKRDIDKAVSDIIHLIIHAADISIPKAQECKAAKKQQQKAWGSFRHYTNSRNYIEYKAARANARRIRRKCHRESWIKYVSSITSETSNKNIWQKVEKVMGIHTDSNISFLSITAKLSHLLKI